MPSLLEAKNRSSQGHGQRILTSSCPGWGQFSRIAFLMQNGMFRWYSSKRMTGKWHFKFIKHLSCCVILFCTLLQASSRSSLMEFSRATYIVKFYLNSKWQLTFMQAAAGSWSMQLFNAAICNFHSLLMLTKWKLVLSAKANMVLSQTTSKI